MKNNTVSQDFFWIELETTQKGQEKLSCKLGDKYYVGFLVEKERKVKVETVMGYYYKNKSYKLAKMVICDWESCRVCSPE